MTRRVLLVGATGTFGTRLARMLAAMPEVELILAARGAAKLDALHRALEAAGAVAAIRTARLDRDAPDALTALAPWLVIDAAGPFQGSGRDLPRAAIATSAHYIDLADGRAYVAAFPAALNAAASEAGVLAVTAASSTPALSHAALDRMVAGWRRIDALEVAIAPGARPGPGLSVVAAILSWVGRPVRVFQGGGWRSAPGWSGTRRIHLPGLGSRLVALCETSDLDLLPARFAVRDKALFLAGLEIGIMHRGLAALALPVRWGLVRSLRPLARPLRAAAALLAPMGGDRGGMVVAAAGADAEGRAVRARWSLRAVDGSGPSVPAAPAAALVRAMLEGRIAATGAVACAGLLELDAIMGELASLPIDARADDARPEAPILFEHLLGSRWDALPAAVAAIHSGRTARATGRAVARAGRGPLARLMRASLGLPASGPHAVAVRIRCDARGERWTRTFGRSRFASRLEDVRGFARFDERIGPLRFRFELRAVPRGVDWDFVGWRVLGLPMPRALGPRVRAGARDEAGRYRFRVTVGVPWGGLLFAYRGWLVPDDAGPSANAPS